MALPLTETDKFLLLSAVGAPETRDRIAALLDLAGTGNMTGPASATDNALVRFDGSTGALVQNSGVIVNDANAITGVASLNGVSAATIAFLDATSSIQTQINTKAPTASPTLTGTVTISGILNATGSTGHSIVGNQTNALIIKSLSGNSNGLRLYSNTATDVGSVVNGYNAALELGANNTVYQTISNAGLITLGASGGALTHVVNGSMDLNGPAGPNLRLIDGGTAGVNADPYFELRDNASPMLGIGYLFGGASNDAALWNYKAGDIRFATNNIEKGKVDSAGNWTIGASGGTQTHIIQGNILTLDNGSGTSFLLRHNDTNQIVQLAGGQSYAGGSALQLEGSAATNGGDFILGSNGLDIIFWDESANALALGKNSSTAIRVNSATTAPGVAVATLANAPAGAAGDPDIWLNVNVNGTVYVIPAWTP